MTFFTTSVDDWLDEKRNLDGAEGLWRIHDKLYDFTIWARSHPGGQFWINTTSGTDITEAFESHHFSAEAEKLLQNYYRKEATAPRNSFTTFNENGFFKKFKRKALEQYPMANVKPTLNHFLVYDGLVAAVFLTGLLGATHGIMWKIASGVLLGFLAILSHGLLHSKDSNWRVYYFNMSLMSARDWRIRHVLSHHQFRGTVFDLEMLVWQPFSKIQCGLPKYLLNLLVFPMVAHLQFIKRCLDVFLSKKLAFDLEELVSFSFPLFLFLFRRGHLWEIFVTWNHIILIGSFVYCFLSSTSNNNHSGIIAKGSTQGDDKDFGIVQLSFTGTDPEEHQSALSFLNSFRGSALHYLCPSVECRTLYKLIPAFVEVSKNFGISLPKTSKPFPEFIQIIAPEGYVFFS